MGITTHSQCAHRHCCPLVWTPSTAINDTAINDAHSTIAIHPFLPLRLLKPPTSSHSPFHPLLIARLASELRHFESTSSWDPRAGHWCQPNSSLTAATPILAFLIALDHLTFKEITAGMVEWWVLMEMHPFVWLSMHQTHDLAFFCSTTQKNLPHTLQCFQNCNYWGICKSIVSKFLHREFVISIICKSNYDDVSFHLEYWIAIIGQCKKGWWLQFAIAGANTNSAIAIAGVIECVLHNKLQELSGREGHCRS
jgi:hypothetical protein